MRAAGLDPTRPGEMVDTAIALGRVPDVGPWALGVVAPALIGRPGVYADGADVGVVGDRLTGVVHLVPFGASFDHLLVPAGDRLYEVATAGPGVVSRSVTSVGDDGCVSFTLRSVTGVELPAVDLTLAVLALAAELVGVAEGALEAAVARVAERHVFGRPVGTYQAIQHRLVDGHIAVLNARLGVIDAAERPAATRVAGAAVLSIDAALSVTATAHQVHGGAGYLSDAAPGTFYRRARSLAPRFGGARAHLARIAADLEP